MKDKGMNFKLLLFVILLVCIFPIFAQDPDWYKSQIGTGYGNCGPAVVAMAIQWSTGQNVTVEYIRTQIGYPISDGATSFNMLADQLKKYNSKVYIHTQKNLEYLVDLVSYGDVIVIVCLNTDTISIAKPGSIFGRTYKENFGHYIILEDVTADYFKVQDPLNNPNRFYKIDEVWAGMNKQYSTFLVVYLR